MTNDTNERRPLGSDAPKNVPLFTTADRPRRNIREMGEREVLYTTPKMFERAVAHAEGKISTEEYLRELEAERGPQAAPEQLSEEERATRRARWEEAQRRADATPLSDRIKKLERK